MQDLPQSRTILDKKARAQKALKEEDDTSNVKSNSSIDEKMSMLSRNFKQIIK